MKNEFAEVNCGYTIPNNSWLRNFSEEFHSPDIRVYREVEDDQHDDFIWSSIHLNEFSDPRMIYERASALNAIFDGAMYIYLGARYEPFWRGQLGFLDNGRAIANLKPNPLVEPFWKEYAEATIEQPDHFVARAIHKSRYDLSVREILLFLGVNGLSWISLYAVLDTVKCGGLDEKTIVAKQIATADEMNLFGQTANNAAAIGPFARHGNKGWKPPQTPMTLQQAKELILRIVNRYVKDRL